MKAEFFLSNRVWRAYLGGSGIGCLCGDPEEKDSHFPEDWIASSIEALNDQYRQPGHGLSKLADGRFFSDYLNENSQEALGRDHIARLGVQPGFLMKILDSAERLPIQVHPTIDDAKKYYHSDRGKTECWVVIGTRKVNGEEPYLLLGCNENMQPEVFLSDARKGDFSRSETMLRKWQVKPGDIFIVPGRVPHAIGPGVTLIEVMEPSDWVVQPEHFCGEQPLTEADRFGPLDQETALGIFGLIPESQIEAEKRYCPRAEIIDRTSDFILEAVVPQKEIKLFEVQTLTGSGEYLWKNRENCCRSGVVVDGAFEINAGDGYITVKSGSSFFLPAVLQTCSFKGSGKIVFALPSYLK